MKNLITRHTCDCGHGIMSLYIVPLDSAARFRISIFFSRYSVLDGQLQPLHEALTDVMSHCRA